VTKGRFENDRAWLDLVWKDTIDAPLLADESPLDHEGLLLQQDTLGDVRCCPPTSDKLREGSGKQMTKEHFNPTAAILRVRHAFVTRSKLCILLHNDKQVFEINFPMMAQPLIFGVSYIYKSSQRILEQTYTRSSSTLESYVSMPS
jgi:hypothetical protein